MRCGPSSSTTAARCSCRRSDGRRARPRAGCARRRPRRRATGCGPAGRRSPREFTWDAAAAAHERVYDRAAELAAPFAARSRWRIGSRSAPAGAADTSRRVRAREHEITIDEPAAHGGGDAGMMPTEALCAAISSCFCLRRARRRQARDRARRAARRRDRVSRRARAALRAFRGARRGRRRLMICSPGWSSPRSGSAGSRTRSLHGVRARLYLHFCRRTYTKVERSRWVLDNRSELEQVLRDRDVLGAVFARHAYGMRRWVDLFSAADPADRRPLRDRARGRDRRHQRPAHGAVPRAGDRARRRPGCLRLPAGGRADLRAPGSAARATTRSRTRSARSSTSATCSPSTPRPRVDPDDAAVLSTVRADNDAALARLREFTHCPDGPAAAAAHELYRLRELAETPLYASRV